MTPSPPDPLEEVSGDVLVLFHFEDVPVPRDALGKVDWCLSGAVSRVALDGKFTGALGRAALFYPAGKFHVEKILVLGLGPRATVDAQALQAAARHLRSLLDSLRARDTWIVLPDPPHIPPQAAIDLFSAALHFPKETSADPPSLRFLTYDSEEVP